MRSRVVFIVFAAAVLLFACCGIVLSHPPVPTATATATARALDAPWPTDRPIRLCALRVEFVPDDISGTTGTGRMGTGFPDTLIFDPLPHNKVYFEDHLRFLGDYYRTVSAGHVTMDPMIVLPAEDDSLYRLNWPMWHYNYNTSDALLSQRLVDLFVEATAAAHERGVDFSQYDAIVIFHAGTGKDFNLGFDATPFDIPSAYISEADIRGYHGSTTVPAGVTRGLVLPEGENQSEALDLGIELSMNGILVKLFGNWLGLPDLYNTQTGRSGIGRWGMMDQGSGNINGLVPAMPDAWSRAFMGWVTPQAVAPNGPGDTVRVARFDHHSAPQIVKFPITPREYYLLENRDADADSIHYVELWDRAGRSLKFFEDGSLQRESGFRVAVRASHYDYGIPGSGLLLWHIDENVIARTLADNTVNHNPDHRGVDLVEADGAQDIGQEYGFATAGYGAELGVFEDAWYRDNDANRAANNDAPVVRFNDHTFPSARFYDGAYTRLELRSFSVVDTVMSCIASLLDVQPGFPVAFPERAEWAVADMNGDRQREIYFLMHDSLFVGDSAIAEVPAGVHFVRPNAPVDVNGDGREDLLFEGMSAGIASQADTIYVTRFDDHFHYDDGARSFPVTTLSGVRRVLVCTDRSTIFPDALVMSFYDTDMQWISDIVFHGFPLAGVFNVDAFPSQRFALVKQGGVIVIAINDTTVTELWRKEDSRISPPAIIVAEPDRRSIYLTGYGYVNAADSVTLCAEPDCQTPGEDWDGDGIPDGGGRFGRTLAAREDFPHVAADTNWIIDLDADGYADVLGMSHSADSSSITRTMAVRHNRTVFSDFPWAADVADKQPFGWNNGMDLFVVSEAQGNGRYFYSVSRLLSAVGQMRFPYRADKNIINVGPLRPQIHARENWFYCWPNPTRDVSYIRITVDHPAQADVLILDLAGRKVAELHGESALAVPFEIPWNVAHVESGVYIGRVTLTNDGDHREGQIKIAVVK